MADRYLLETSAVDGYQLEDGSGVLILEGAAANVLASQLRPLFQMIFARVFGRVG